MTLGDRIRIRREQLHMSQEELAEKIGYKSRSSINKIENEAGGLPQSKIAAIAKALQTTPEFIMGWDSKGKEEPVTSPVMQEIAGILSGMSEEQLAQVASYVRFIKSGG